VWSAGVPTQRVVLDLDFALFSQNGLAAPFYDTIKKNLSGLADRFQFCCN